MSPNHRPRTVLGSLLGLASLSAAFTTTGCAPSLAALSADEVRTHGTQVYEAPRRMVLPAVLKTLISRGYDVELLDLQRGLVQTGRRAEHAPASPLDPLPATRRYDVYVAERAGRTTVTLLPRRFRGAQEVPQTDRSWRAGSERMRWAQMFYEIHDAYR